MINRINQLFIILLILLPLFLITGPAIPDIIITFSGIFFLIFIVFKEVKFSIINNSFVQISIIFWLSLIFISFFAVDKGRSFQDSIIFLRFLIIPISCYFLFFNKNKIFNYLIFIIFITVIFVSIDTLFQFFNYTSKDGFGADLLGFKSNWYGRLTGPFGDELIPGSYVSKFGLLGYVFILVNKKFKFNFFIQVLYLSTILVVCFVSGERMALATYGLALILLFLFLKENRSAVFISIILGLTIMFSIYKIHPFYNDYKIIESNQYHQGLKIEKNYICENEDTEICSKIIDLQPKFIEIIKNFSTSAYGEIYLLSFKMFQDNPITGIGLSNFKFLCNNESHYNNLMTNYRCASHPHNKYIQWMAEGGLIVLTLFLIYLLVLFNFIYKNNGDREYKIISIVILIILFWPIMSTGSLIKNWYGISVFFITGLSMCLSRIKKDI